MLMPSCALPHPLCNAGINNIGNNNSGNGNLGDNSTGSDNIGNSFPLGSDGNSGLWIVGSYNKGFLIKGNANVGATRRPCFSGGSAPALASSLHSPLAPPAHGRQQH
jgi:hypothetical protein